MNFDHQYKRLRDTISVKRAAESLYRTVKGTLEAYPGPHRLMTSEEYELLKEIVDPIIDQKEASLIPTFKFPTYYIWTSDNPILKKREKAEYASELWSAVEGYLLMIPNIPIKDIEWVNPNPA